MNTEKILKKLEEIKVDAINNLTSDDTKSKLQVGSDTEVPLDEDAAGEDTKKEPILGEESKDPYYLKLRNLSRVTPMAGAESPPEKIYTSGEEKKVKKTITIESIQAQLDDLKKDMNIWRGHEDGINAQTTLTELLKYAISIPMEAWSNPQNPGIYTDLQNEVERMKNDRNNQLPKDYLIGFANMLTRENNLRGKWLELAQRGAL